MWQHPSGPSLAFTDDPLAAMTHWQDALQRALALHGAGHLGEAERSYRACLDARPDHFDALHWLGVLAAQQGRFNEALELLGKALDLNPESAEAHTNHANVLKARGRFEDALMSYDKALAIRPGFAEVLCNRGAVLADLGRHEEALASYDTALAIRPDYAEALSNRGNTLSEIGRYDEALASYDRAVAVKPDYAEALSNRGVVLLRLGRHEDALASFDDALARRPAYAEALSNRANSLCALHRYEEALASCDAALAIEPGYAKALNNRGNALQDLKRYAEALASYDRALAVQPAYAEAFSNRANVLRDLQRYEEALASCDQALSIRPALAGAFTNRGEILRCLRRYDEAANDFERALDLDCALPDVRGALLHARMHACDWRNVDRDTRDLTADVRSGKRSCAPFVLLAVSESPEDQLRCARTWARHNVSNPTPIWKGERYGHDKIRVAYLSADFHEHATMHLMAGLFERHDRSRFETTAVSFGPEAADEMQSRVKPTFQRFVDVSLLSDREAADLLRELEIDIAVDLKGFTTHCRPGILASRPAPVQVSYLGYPGTMGVDFIDYIVADEWVIPREHHGFYSERIVYLPDSYQVNDAKRSIASHTPDRADAGLPEHGFVFCSFNNPFKINPRIFDCWMRLLNKVEGGVLWLLEGNASAPRNLRREAAARGIAPERLVFAPVVPLEDHLARHRLADLFVDTLPYNAHTTASDALWAGLPVVTCTGHTFAGRVATSLLHAAGLPQLARRDLREYEALALELATKPALLAEVRHILADKRDRLPLFDTDRFRQHIESAYERMWQRYQRGEEPASFGVGARDDMSMHA